MSNADPAASLSPRRQRLSSFENSYAVALQRQRQTGVSQFILRTANPLQPFRTTVRPDCRKPSWRWSLEQKWAALSPPKNRACVHALPGARLHRFHGRDDRHNHRSVGQDARSFPDGGRHADIV